MYNENSYDSITNGLSPRDIFTVQNVFGTFMCTRIITWINYNYLMYLNYLFNYVIYFMIKKI